MFNIFDLQIDPAVLNTVKQSELFTSVSVVKQGRLSNWKQHTIACIKEQKYY